MIDLHMHTNLSDGVDTVEELLVNCEEAKLDIISITDHNTVRPYQRLENITISDYYSGKIINGIELDIVVNGKAIELLAYDFDVYALGEWVENAYKSTEERQVITYNALVEKCRENGIIINESLPWEPGNEYAHQAIFRKIMSCEENSKHPDVQFDSYREFYRATSADKNHPLYVDFSIVYPTIEEVIDKMHEAKGKMFLAHLFYYDVADYENFLDKLFAEYDIDGIEVYHYSFSNEQIEWLKEYCKKNNLLMCGGSDYHGTIREGQLGIGKGHYRIPESLIDDWYNG